ncbi:TIGR03086 family metal-binding protein [Actinomadura chokoriensis]|uniref:TIGR03086 family metal-binding protein n=1 Tax=Actinomadura chokoriensis TaxID=454156 RepID=A0ABV4QVN7_9ACTN
MDVLTELTTTDFRPLDRRASELYLSAVAQVKPDALALPTPCADWTLHGLLRHQISQDQGFAAAARGEGDRLPAWNGGDLGDDPYAAARASADLVTRAFADVALDAELALPELGGRFPAALAISFHLVDLVVHAWDVAATLGVPWEPADDLVGAALNVAAIVPEESRGPGASFAPKLEPAGGASPGERLLTLLGREPSWR